MVTPLATKRLRYQDGQSADAKFQGVSQTKFKNRPGGYTLYATSNSLQASVATVLGFDLDEVPDFEWNQFHHKTDWWVALNDFFFAKGYELEVVKHEDVGPRTTYFSSGALTIARGIDLLDEEHYCVYHHGELLWEPRPTIARVATVNRTEPRTGLIYQDQTIYEAGLKTIIEYYIPGWPTS